MKLTRSVKRFLTFSPSLAKLFMEVSDLADSINNATVNNTVNNTVDMKPPNDIKPPSSPKSTAGTAGTSRPDAPIRKINRGRVNKRPKGLAASHSPWVKAVRTYIERFGIPKRSETPRSKLFESNPIKVEVTTSAAATEAEAAAKSTFKSKDFKDMSDEELLRFERYLRRSMQAGERSIQANRQVGMGETAKSGTSAAATATTAAKSTSKSKDVQDMTDEELLRAQRYAQRSIQAAERSIQANRQMEEGATATSGIVQNVNGDALVKEQSNIVKMDLKKLSISLKQLNEFSEVKRAQTKEPLARRYFDPAVKEFIEERATSKEAYEQLLKCIFNGENAAMSLFCQLAQLKPDVGLNIIQATADGLIKTKESDWNK